MLNKVPDCVFHEICQYLYYTNWNQFMNTTKKFQDINRQTRYLALNNQKSILYYESDDFRKIINSKIINPNNQLSLNLRKYNFDNNNINDIFNIHKLDLYFSNINNNNLNYFRSIKKLNLTGCMCIYDLAPLKMIQEINLSYCYYIKDLSPLKKAIKVILSECKILENISDLKDVKIIFLSNCPKITDFTPLKNANILYITNCQGKFDAKDLYTVDQLYIHCCYNVNNIHKLKEKKNNNLSIYFYQ